MVTIAPSSSTGDPFVSRGRCTIACGGTVTVENNESHHASAEGPFPHHDKFAVIFHYETTAKERSRKGQHSEFRGGRGLHRQGREDRARRVLLRHGMTRALLLRDQALEDDDVGMPFPDG